MIDLVGETDVMPEAPAHILIHVVNRNPFVVRDRFDGVPVVFKPNEKVTLTREQARHFFAYPGDPMDIAYHMAKRFGWSTLEYTKRDPIDGPDGPTLYQKYAWNFEFSEQEFELVPKQKNADDGLEDVSDLPAGAAPPVPETPPSRVGRRTGSPASSVPRRRPGRPRRKQAESTPPVT